MTYGEFEFEHHEQTPLKLNQKKTTFINKNAFEKYKILAISVEKPNAASTLLQFDHHEYNEVKCSHKGIVTP